MNNRNEIRYDLILGFVTVVISLSAFKEELSQIIVDLNFIKFTLSQYFFVFILGTTSCFYLYSLERLLTALPLKQFQLLIWIQKIAYWLFTFFLLSPIALAFIWLFAWSGIEMSLLLRVIVNSIIGSTVAYFALYLIKRIYDFRKEKRLEELSNKETIDLETAEKLFRQNFHNQSLILISNVIETHLTKLLQQNNIQIPKIGLNKIVKYCFDKNLITKDDLIRIETISQMRNDAVHLKKNVTENEIETALEFTKKLLLP